MDHHNVVSLHISGHLWAQPVPLEFLLRTELDLETGQVQVRELRG
jgi:type VI secretion system protein ImpF